MTPIEQALVETQAWHEAALQDRDRAAGALTAVRALPPGRGRARAVADAQRWLASAERDAGRARAVLEALEAVRLSPCLQLRQRPTRMLSVPLSRALARRARA